MLASRTFRVNTTSGAASAGARTFCLYRSPALQQQRTIAARGFGKDAVEGWLDLAKLVASEGSKSKSPYEELAYQIGRDVYVDIAGWHLFLRDMSAVPGLKMSHALATKLGPEVGSAKLVGLKNCNKIAAVMLPMLINASAQAEGSRRSSTLQSAHLHCQQKPHSPNCVGAGVAAAISACAQG
eukprot:GHRQ01010809.1.p1 GENE.GHRQ01010809.1~~GHRQ01010809.1.p1  ORF type:complete len:183 (+),score=47.46 GHRQ01010809.1:201-749(+)